jgi:L,D-peptidoglycan transpeptidase YkuD (ErfK/YbiS/YcfS/YnhG family)
MNLIVTPDRAPPHRGRLVMPGRTMTCALGRGGVSTAKREGDGCTPAGTFPLRRVLYRADRVAAPRTRLPVSAIGRHDGWCDAPHDPAYNRPVALPYRASAERLWREDRLYDVVVVLGHNDDPVVPGAGSAIFLHVAAPGHAPTEGCVALALADLMTVLERCAPGTALTVHSAPS